MPSGRQSLAAPPVRARHRATARWQRPGPCRHHHPGAGRAWPLLRNAVVRKSHALTEKQRLRLQGGAGHQQSPVENVHGVWLAPAPLETESGSQTLGRDCLSAINLCAPRRGLGERLAAALNCAHSTEWLRTGERALGNCRRGWGKLATHSFRSVTSTWHWAACGWLGAALSNPTLS